MMSRALSRRAALVAVLALALASMQLMGCAWSFGFDASTDSVTEEYAFEDVSSVDLDLSACEVIFRRGDQATVTVARKNYPEVKVEVVDGTLRITEGAGTSGLVNDSSCKVMVTVPEDCELDFLALEVDAGLIEVSDVRADQVDVDVEAGEVTLVGVTANVATVTVDAGTATVKGLANMQDANISLEAEVGEVLVNGNPQGSSYHQTGTGASLTVGVEAGTITVEE